MSNKNTKKLPLPVGLALMLAVIIAVAVSTGSNDKKGTTASNNSSTVQTLASTEYSADGDKLTVHFLDVGQGDSEFIELPNGQCMLIDASTSSYSDEIIEEIEELGYGKIDYLVATHPHSDHIGGMREVIEEFDVGSVYMPRASTTSKTYEKLLKAIASKGLKINTAKAGKSIDGVNGVDIQFLSPISAEYDDLNNYSCVMKITYSNSSFLFTGDAENIVENEMMNTDISELSADVLKVGHHGSSYSTSTRFLNAVSPEYAVISCGKGNSYGHPHKETLQRLDDAGITTYRTDLLGTITISTNGNGSYDVDY